MSDYNVYNQFIIDMLDAMYAGVIPLARQGYNSFDDCLEEMYWRLDGDYPEVLLEYYITTFNHLIGAK